MHKQVSLSAGAKRDDSHGELPGWLRWFANLGLSLSAADCAITSVPPRTLASVPEPAGHRRV